MLELIAKWNVRTSIQSERAQFIVIQYSWCPWKQDFSLFFDVTTWKWISTHQVCTLNNINFCMYQFFLSSSFQAWWKVLLFSNKISFRNDVQWFLLLDCHFSGSHVASRSGFGYLIFRNRNYHRYACNESSFNREKIFSFTTLRTYLHSHASHI